MAAAARSRRRGSSSAAHKALISSQLVIFATLLCRARPPGGNSAYAAPRCAALILNKRPGREQRADPVFMRNAEREGEEKRCGKKEQLARPG